MIPEVEWKKDPAVDAVRKLPGWREFHKACAKHRVFFDHIEKRGKLYVCDTYTGSGRETARLCQGAGSTPLEALLDAYRQSKWQIPEADEAVTRMRRGPVDDLEESLGL